MQWGYVAGLHFGKVCARHASSLVLSIIPCVASQRRNKTMVHSRRFLLLDSQGPPKLQMWDLAVLILIPRAGTFPLPWTVVYMIPTVFWRTQSCA